MSKLRALLDAATPGPWRILRSRSVDPMQASDYGIVSDALSHIPDEALPLIGEVFSERLRSRPNGVQARSDAALIVALRNAAPLLLDLVDAVRLNINEHGQGVTPMTPEWVNAMAAQRDALAALDATSKETTDE